MTKPMRGMTMGVSRYAKSIEKSLEGPHRALSAIDTKMRSVAQGLAIGGAIAAGGLVMAGQAGANFEEAITAVGAVSLMTRDQIADLEKEALRLGSSTKFTATEAANAMEVMGRAGFTNAEVLKAIPGVLNAAAAEGAEMAEVTSHVSNVLKGLGLEASEAGRVADVLTLASARTNSSISSLGESMKNLSPVAKQFGIRLEDAVGMVALLQDVGLDASEAGTATATMLTKLAKPADEVAAKMRQMGVAFQDAHGNMLPPLEIFQNMQGAAKKLGGNMDQVAFFADLVGLRGQKAALNLKDLFSSEKGQGLTAELRNAAGSAEKMAALRMQNLKGDLTILSSTVEGLQIKLFNLESGPLRGVVQGITAWVSANEGLIVSKFGEYMDKLSAALPTVVLWLERIGKILLSFYAVRGVTAVVYGLAKAWGALSMAMASNPWTLLAYGIIAAGTLIWAFWPEISAFFGKVWGGIKNFAASAWATLTGWGNSILGWFSGLWDAIKGPALGFATFFVGLVSFWAKPYIWAFKQLAALAGWAFARLTAIWAPVGAWFGGLWDGVASRASSAWSSIAGAVSTAWGLSLIHI